MNGEYIRNHVSTAEFSVLARPYAERHLGVSVSDAEWERAVPVLPLVQERVKLLSEVGPQLSFLLEAGIEYDERSWRKVMRAQTVEPVLSEAISALGQLGEWRTETIEETLRGLLTRLEVNARRGFQPIRVAVTGSSISPPLFESIAALGRERTMTGEENQRACRVPDCI